MSIWEQRVREEREALVEMLERLGFHVPARILKHYRGGEITVPVDAEGPGADALREHFPELFDSERRIVLYVEHPRETGGEEPGEGQPPLKFKKGQRFKGQIFGEPATVTLNSPELVDVDDEEPFWIWGCTTMLGGAASISESILAEDWEFVEPTPAEVLKDRLLAAMGLSVPFDTDLEEALDEFVEHASGFGDFAAGAQLGQPFDEEGSQERRQHLSGQEGNGG